jgi:hypothetical protein
MSDAKQIALTIYDQITLAPEGSHTGIGRLRAMLGARLFHFTELASGSVLTEFDFKMCRKFNRCHVTYRPSSDDYSLHLRHVNRKGFWQGPDQMIDGLYAWDLARVFTEHTGLDTHL